MLRTLQRIGEGSRSACSPDYGTRVKIVYIAVPYKTLNKQNSNREHKVPEKVFDKLIWRLEIPTVRAARDLAFVKEGCCSSGLFYEI